MEYDFDTVIDRRGTNSLKYDFADRWGMPEDVLPMWVADMDFPAAPEILDRLKEVLQHGIFGYSEGKEEYFRAVAGWYGQRFGWEVKEEWLVKTPGVVFAIAMAVRSLTKEQDAVLIQQPVYYPFSGVIKDNNRVLVNNALKLTDGRYEIDFEDFEEKIVKEHVKLFILCSPHNPVGRVWEEWELRKMGDICVKHGVWIVSDEIHSDFVRPGYRHLVFASLSPDYADNTVTCTAPSKTFNLAGLQTSNIFIPNPDIRHRFAHAMKQVGCQEINTMGLAACQAAYEKGGPWLGALKEYLEGNLSLVREYLAEHLPKIHLIEPEGTYLAWLDFRELGLTEEARQDLIIKKARLWLDSGAMFGKDGEGFERINLACPRSVVKRALVQLERAVMEL